MSLKLVQLGIGFFCGYLFIMSFPVVSPFSLSEIILEFVLHPFEFFIASVVFIIGFMVNALMIKEGVEQVISFIYQKQINIMAVFNFLLLIIGFSVLFVTGFWQTVVFFSFSMLYGIISLDFKRFKIIEE